MWKTCSPTACCACRGLEPPCTYHWARCLLYSSTLHRFVLLLFMDHRTHLAQWTLLALAAGPPLISTVNSSALLALYHPSPVYYCSSACPPFFLPVCAHPVGSNHEREGAFSPVKLKQVLPFPKPFSKEPVATRHLCLGGGCIVSPPCLFQCFLQSAVVVLVPPVAQVIYYLVFKHLGKKPLPISCHGAIF